MNDDIQKQHHETQESLSSQSSTILNRKEVMEKLYRLTYPTIHRGSLRAWSLLSIPFLQPALIGWWLVLLGYSSFSFEGDFYNSVLDFQWIFQIVSIILVILYVFGLLITVGVVNYNKHVEANSIWANILKCMQISVELNLHIAAFLMSLSVWHNITLFICAAFLSLFSCIFVENFSQRNDTLYCSSAKSKLIYKLIQLATYSFSVTFFITQNITLYCLSILALSAILLGWYLISGYRIYTYSFSKIMLDFNLALHFTVCFNLLGRLISSNQLLFNAILEQVLSIGIVFLCLRLISIDNINFLTSKLNKKTENIKELNFFVENYQQIGDQNKQAMILGLINAHESQNCNNIYCYLNREISYDPILQIYHKEKMVKSNQLIKFYLKCRYQSGASGKSSIGVDNKLQYCQFMLNQYPNIIQIAQVCEALSKEQLNLLQRIQLCKIKEATKIKSDHFNNNLYDGRLQIEKIISAEDCISNIQLCIKKYTFDNIEIWNGFKNAQISLSSIRQQICEGFQLIQEIDSLWLKLIEHFSYQKRWKYIYFNYLLYLKNKKLKPKDIEEFGLIPKEDEIFTTIKIFKEHHQKKKFIDKNLLFDPETCCIHVVLENEQLIVKRISQYFTKIFHYEAEQIVGSTMDQLLPIDIREQHKKIIQNWINQGFCSDADSYNIRLTGCLNRYSEQLPVIKYYKQHYDLQDNCIQFICMLKLNCKEQISQIIKRDITKDNECSNQESNLTDLMAKAGQKKSNLSEQTNIFIKQDCYTPYSSIKQIDQIRYLIRAYSLIIVFTVGVLTLVNNADSSNLVSYATQYITFMELYRIPMILGNNYYKSLLGVGNYTKTSNDITQLTNKMQQYISNPIILKTLFDQKINSPAEFHSIQTTELNLTLTLNQIQLFFTVASCTTSLNTLPVLEQDVNFRMFRSYLKPGYDKFLNNTKNNFHSSFQSIFESINTKQAIMLGAQSLILLIFSVISFLKIYKFFQRMKNIIETILNFHQKDIDVVYHYWCHTFIVFQNLIFRNQCMKNRTMKQIKSKRKTEFNMKKISELRIKSVENMFTTMNNSKILIASKQASRFQIKMFLLLLLSLLLAYSMVMFCEVSAFNNFKSLVEFEQDGFTFLQYFPTATIVSYGILQKYYLQSRGLSHLFNKTNYQDVISNMELVGQFSYISTIKDNSSNYYIKQRNYFFGNPCISNPGVIQKIGISLQKCLLLTNASFTRGLSAYMREGLEIARPFLQGTRSISKTQLDQFSLSVGVLSAYILDAITTWGVQFNERVKAITTAVTNLNIIQMISILLCHFLIFQLIILQLLNKEYRFYRRVFQQMVPQYLLIKEKLIRQRFIELQIIPSN